MAKECPTPNKKTYDTKGAAQFFAYTDGLRSYKCPCGKWHLSSKNVKRTKRVRR